MLAPMPRAPSALLSRTSPLRAEKPHGGNGTPLPNVQPDRLARIESLLESIEKRLDTQFQRIADIQVQLDRVAASQPKP